MYQRHFFAHRGWNLRNSDASLSLLLLIQCLMTFVLAPLVAIHVVTPRLVDVGLLSFAVICAVVYAERVRTLLVLLGCMVAIVSAPWIWQHWLARSSVDGFTLHETILAAAFVFNALITGLVTRHTFGVGKVTRHRILGAVLVYLNVAILFSITYDLIETWLGGTIGFSTGAGLPPGLGARRAEFTYFSLVTITTCGYGDIVPIHPVVRSLTNIEAFFGQLFPATFVARLVALHLTHDEAQGKD